MNIHIFYIFTRTCFSQNELPESCQEYGDQRSKGMASEHKGELISKSQVHKRDSYITRDFCITSSQEKLLDVIASFST